MPANCRVRLTYTLSGLKKIILAGLIKDQFGLDVDGIDILTSKEWWVIIGRDRRKVDVRVNGFTLHPLGKAERDDDLLDSPVMFDLSPPVQTYLLTAVSIGVALATTVALWIGLLY